MIFHLFFVICYNLNGDNMNNYSFWNYDEKAEAAGGDYWRFLDATAEEIIKAQIFLYDMNKIIPKIKNEELKEKMLSKLKALIEEQGIDFQSVSQSLNLFSQEEIKSLLEHIFNKKIQEYLSNQDVFRKNISSINSFLFYLEIIEDFDWHSEIFIKIVDKVKNYSNKEFLIRIVEMNRIRNCQLYNKLINEYFSYFPLEYKNYLKMNSDSEYVNKKIEQLMDQDLNIGIDPNIKIGVEIEANKSWPIEIDLASQSGCMNYHVTNDATVIPGNEIKTVDPFCNKKEEVARFCAICESMKDVGYYYDENSNNAAGQINLGLDYLDTKEAILNFYEIYCNCEELLYYISSEEGQLFRQNIYNSSRIKPISEIIGNRIFDEELSRKDVIKLFNSKLTDDENALYGLDYKKNSVCLRGSSEEDYRFEFRIPNGGCNYQTWIDNIRLYGKMMEVAKRLSEISKKDGYLTEEENELLSLKIELQNDSLTLEEKLDILMDMLFKDEKLKQIYKNRYNATIKKIIETGSNNYKKLCPVAIEPSFAEVEFQEQYHSRFDINNESGSYLFDENGNPVKNGKSK